MKRSQLIDYLVLASILAIGVWVFYSVRTRVAYELFTGIGTSVAYVLWGIIHHARQGDLHPKIVVEYMLIGAIAIVLLVTVLGF